MSLPRSRRPSSRSKPFLMISRCVSVTAHELQCVYALDIDLVYDLQTSYTPRTAFRLRVWTSSGSATGSTSRTKDSPDVEPRSSRVVPSKRALRVCSNIRLPFIPPSPSLLFLAQLFTQTFRTRALDDSSPAFSPTGYGAHE